MLLAEDILRVSLVPLQLPCTYWHLLACSYIALIIADRLGRCGLMISPILARGCRNLFDVWTTL